MSRGIVVDHKESGVRYAVSEHNFNAEVHTKVRELKPGETVISFSPRPKGSLAGPGDTATENSPASEQAALSATAAETPVPTISKHNTTK